MEIGKHWESIRKVFKQSWGNYAFGTVNEDGTPHVTPIGSLFLRNDQSGFYFEEYSRHMSKNFKTNQRVCVSAVNFHKLFWIKAFILGRYPAPVAVRLLGYVGERRAATTEEIAMFQNSLWPWLVRNTRMKGYNVSWKNMKHVRDIYFDSFEPIHAGVMTTGHWE